MRYPPSPTPSKPLLRATSLPGYGIKQQLNLSETDFNRDKTLFDTKTISAREFENKKKDYLLSQLNPFLNIISSNTKHSLL